MRIKNIQNLFKPGRYSKLSHDFKNPLAALYAISGISRKQYQLTTKTGDTIKTNREDSPVWEEYFLSKWSNIIIEKGLFKVTPHDRSIPQYFINGGTQCFTHNPTRWNARKNRPEIINEIEHSERKIYSQHGEDGIIETLLKIIPVSHKYIVEFGAYDGVGMSNSRHLIKDKDWKSLLIEADNKLFAKLKRLYSKNDQVTTINEFITEENINAIFRKSNVPQDLEILSIDVDSIDYYIWRGLTDFRPKIVIVEYNSSISPDKDYIVPKHQAIELGGTSLEGASISSWNKLGIEKGYQLIYGELYGSNLFFIDNKYTEELDTSDIKITDTYQPPQFGMISGGTAQNGRGYR